MKQIATLRMTQTAARYAEHAPVATACCNACRACVQANLMGIALAGLASAVHFGRRLARRR